jgi:hypothetical protein
MNNSLLIFVLSLLCQNSGSSVQTETFNCDISYCLAVLSFRWFRILYEVQRLYYCFGQLLEEFASVHSDHFRKFFVVPLYCSKDLRKPRMIVTDWSHSTTHCFYDTHAAWLLHFAWRQQNSAKGIQPVDHFGFEKSSKYDSIFYLFVDFHKVILNVDFCDKLSRLSNDSGPFKVSSLKSV